MALLDDYDNAASKAQFKRAFLADLHKGKLWDVAELSRHCDIKPQMVRLLLRRMRAVPTDTYGQARYYGQDIADQLKARNRKTGKVRTYNARQLHKIIFSTRALAGAYDYPDLDAVAVQAALLVEVIAAVNKLPPATIRIDGSRAVSAPIACKLLASFNIDPSVISN